MILTTIDICIYIYIYIYIYIHIYIYINSNLNPLTECTSSSKSTKFIDGKEHLSNDHKDRPNQHKNSHKLYDETGDPVLGLMESQWKLRQQHDQNFTMDGKAL